MPLLSSTFGQRGRWVSEKKQNHGYRIWKFKATNKIQVYLIPRPMIGFYTISSEKKLSFKKCTWDFRSASEVWSLPGWGFRCSWIRPKVCWVKFTECSKIREHPEVTPFTWLTFTSLHAGFHKHMISFEASCIL